MFNESNPLDREHLLQYISNEYHDEAVKQHGEEAAAELIEAIIPFLEWSAEFLGKVRASSIGMATDPGNHVVLLTNGKEVSIFPRSEGYVGMDPGARSAVRVSKFGVERNMQPADAVRITGNKAQMADQYLKAVGARAEAEKRPTIDYTKRKK